MRGVVALGGALGSVVRLTVEQALPTGRFPLATLLVNLSGAFALAWLLGRGVGERARAGLGVGFLGSFTTFSALVVQTDRLLLTDPGIATAYLLATLALGLVAVVLGHRFGAGVRPDPTASGGPR